MRLNLPGNDSGESMVEYMLLVALVALAVLASVRSIGTWLATLFGWLGSASQYLNN